MDIKKFYCLEGENPLDRFPEGLSFTSIFRKIAFIGDSLSSGEFESLNNDGSRGYHDFYEYSWGQHIARKCGITAYNFSAGGMHAKAYVDHFADSKRFWSPEYAAQAYVIALGANDILNMDQTVGTLDDICAEDYTKNADSFVGWYSQIIMRYKEIQPDAKFFLVTLPRGDMYSDEKRLAHREALYKMAEYFTNTYVIDLYKYAPVYDEEFMRHFFLYGHMNAAGYVFTANMIDAYIDYIVRKHPEDFSRVAYIGTNLK